MRRKIFMAIIAFTFPIGLLVLVAPSPASAKQVPARRNLITLPGGFACDSGFGAMTFIPPLTLFGSYSSGVVTIEGRMNRCASFPPAVRAGYFVFSGPMITTNCFQLVSSLYQSPIGGYVIWDPADYVDRSVLPIVPSYESYGFGLLTYSLPGPKPRLSWPGYVTDGSFAGLGITLTLTLRHTIREILDACRRGPIATIDFSDYGN